MLKARSLAQENSSLSSNNDFDENIKKRTRKPVTYKKKYSHLIPSPLTPDFKGNIRQFIVIIFI